MMMISEQKPVGILLTAGAQVDKEGNLEPNLEGQIRSLGALSSLTAGDISKLYVTGGQLFSGVPTSAIYVAYLRKVGREQDLRPASIQRLKGRVDTGSDLEKAVKYLPVEDLQNCTIFSSGFHLERAELVLRSFGVQSTSKACEEVVKIRTERFDALINEVYTPDFLNKMRKREISQIKILKLDSLPLIGKFHPGLKILGFLASRTRQGENS